MRKYLLAIVAIFALAPAAFADCNGAFVNDCQNSNTTIQGGAGGDGGDAEANARAFASSLNVNWNSLSNSQRQTIYNHLSNSQRQGQDQDQYQHQGQGQDQLQGQVGIVKDGDVVIQQSSKVEAEPAIAPSMTTGDPTAPCIVPFGVSGAGGGVFALGVSSGTYDEVCGGLEFYRVTGNDPRHAEQASRVVDLAYHKLSKRLKAGLTDEEIAEVEAGGVKSGATPASFKYTSNGARYELTRRERNTEANTLDNGLRFYRASLR